MKCNNCSYDFDPMKEGNARKRKCGMCCFGDSYSVRSKKEYKRNLLFTLSPLFISIAMVFVLFV